LQLTVKNENPIDQPNGCPPQKQVAAGLAEEPTQEGLLPGFAVDFGDGFGKRDVLGAGLDAILGVCTLFDAAVAQKSLDAFFSVHCACRVHVKETDLADDGGSNEIVVGVDLRTDFQARAARDTTRKWVTLFLDFGGDTGAFAEIIGAVDRNPGFDALEGFEHELAIDGEIADDGKFGQRLNADGLFELIDKGRTGHANPTIDDHGAGTADFLQAVGFVGDGSGLFAVTSDGIFGDVAKTDDDIHGRTPLEGEFLPVSGLVGRLLAFDFDDDCFVRHETPEKDIASRK